MPKYKCLKIFLIFLIMTLARSKLYEMSPAHHNQTLLKISKRSPDSAKSQNNVSKFNKNPNHLSHMSGSSRKIQLYLKNHYIQLIPNTDGNSRGIVNGTISDLSNYSILQRTSVDVGQVKFQSIASCLFLCLDSCGYVYATEHFNDDCVFNEIMEQHHYNIYFSTFHSDEHQKIYLALDRFGQPRKTILPYDRPLGKLASYVKSLTVSVPHANYEELISTIYGSHNIRHSIRRLCSNRNPNSTQKIIPEEVEKCKMKTKRGENAKSTKTKDKNHQQKRKINKKN